jgi:drug/metabolite transporter (DMT)-like permease
MLNSFARFLLVSTSLAPIFGAVAVNQFARDVPWTRWLWWLAAGVLLVAVCWAMLHYASRHAQKHKFRITEFERNDQEVLAFLLAYLLPFVAAENMSFTGEWLTGAYILGIIFLVIAHAGALHFNPVMGLLGYHFYAIRNDDGVSQLLISKTELRRPGREVETVRLAHHIYLHTGGKDA